MSSRGSLLPPLDPGKPEGPAVRPAGGGLSQRRDSLRDQIADADPL